MPRLPTWVAPVAAAILAGTVIVACGGSGHPRRSASASTGGSNPSQTQARQDGLSFARCMRSHGVPHFPDPSSGGGAVNFNSIPGVNQSSPAFRAAMTACNSLLPVKHPASQPPSAHAYARLLRWAECMRTHGISRLPDPKPDPVPTPGSAGTTRYHGVMGDGGYWVGIPTTVDAHSPAFMRLSTVCGESPTGHHA